MGSLGRFLWECVMTLTISQKRRGKKSSGFAHTRSPTFGTSCIFLRVKETSLSPAWKLYYGVMIILISPMRKLRLRVAKVFGQG